MWPRTHELDEKFGERMNRLAEKRYGVYKNRRYWLNNYLGRLYICYLGQFCHIDLYGGHQSESTSSRLHKEDFDPRFSSTNKNRWWQPLSTALFALSAIRITLNTYYQYIYDYHMLRYERFKLHDSTSTDLVVQSGHHNQTSSCLNTTHHQLESHSSSSNRSAYHRHSSPLSSPSNSSGHHSQSHSFKSTPLVRGNDSVGICWTTGMQMLRNVEMARDALRNIGSPYMNLNFVIQIIYLFLVLSSLYLIVIMKYYHSHVEPFDYSLIRAILDLKSERRICNRVIREEINKFIGSSRNFTQAYVEQSQQFVKEYLSHNFKLEQIYERDQLQRLLFDHHLTIRQLEQMALDGVLYPYNRTPKWIAKVTHYSCFYSLLIMGYAFGGVLFFAMFFFIILGVEVNLTTLDILVITEAGVLVALIVICGVFYIVLTLISSIDQICIVDIICRRIERCIMKNQAKFFEIINIFSSNQEVTAIKRLDRNLSIPSLTSIQDNKKQPNKLRHLTIGSLTSSKEFRQNRHSLLVSDVDDHSYQGELLLKVDWYCAQMNYDLLEVLMRYKIMVAQIRPITKSIGLFGFGCVLLMIFTPLNVRIHFPYIDEKIKLYAMMFAVLIGTIADLSFIPICYMFSRLINIYRHLSSLLAHTIEISSHQNAGQIYDMHTIWLLRKELNHPDRLVNQFTIFIFGFKVTYSSLLRLHFWVGLIAMSIIIDTSSSTTEFFGSILKDPLGMLR